MKIVLCLKALLDNDFKHYDHPAGEKIFGNSATFCTFVTSNDSQGESQNGN